MMHTTHDGVPYFPHYSESGSEVMKHKPSTGLHEYKCIYVSMAGIMSDTEGMHEYANKCTQELNEYVRRGWEIIHIDASCFHLKRGYRIQVDEAA